MDVFEEMIDYFSHLGFPAEWPLIQEVFVWRARMKPAHWRLPGKACLAVGGTLTQAIPAQTALACLQTGILIIDDLLDKDGRMDQFETNLARLSNLASAFNALGHLAIDQSSLDAGRKNESSRSLDEMLIATSVGQFLDEQKPADEADYWHLIRLKSAPFFGCTFQIGALAGKASIAQAKEIYHLGHLYGELIQIQDDLHDAFETPANADWIQGRTSLPILFAECVDHPDRSEFLKLRQTFADGGSIEEAQQILIRCGALSYCVFQFQNRFQEVHNILDTLNLPDPQPFKTLFEQISAPIQEMIALGEKIAAKK